MSDPNLSIASTLPSLHTSCSAGEAGAGVVFCGGGAVSCLGAVVVVCRVVGFVALIGP